MRFFFVCILLACSASTVFAETSLQDFARHERYRDVKLSPNGDYLAASAVINDRSVLSLIDLHSMKGVNIVPRDADELARFWWVGPHRVMYTVGYKVGGL